MRVGQAEYIWLDGTKPTQTLRNKTRIVPVNLSAPIELSNFPEWSFDGSSTGQSPGHSSDLILKPVNYVYDPLRGDGNYLVMCEVFNSDGTPHETNVRAALREEMDKGAGDLDPWIGFEQEYTLYSDGRPLGWPKIGFPPPQGPFYCSVGADRAYGREIIEAHTDACIAAGLMIYGTNAEVMPGQWEYQIGYRGLEGESADPINVSDHLWMSRWLMERIAEDFSVVVSYDPKPEKGDWNGAGTHTNFSTRDMRNEQTGWSAIMAFSSALEKKHAEHITEYGAGLSNRLTGEHETCDIDTFRMGERDRGASIRIPDAVSRQRCGYLEDRRPGANCDPYRVAARLLKTLNELADSVEKTVKKSKGSADTQRA